MLRRFVSWLLADRTPDAHDEEPEMTDVAQVLAPYRDEPAPPVLRLADPVRD